MDQLIKLKSLTLQVDLDDELLQHAILQLGTTLYDNRSDFKVGTIVSDVPTETKSILNSYKNMFI